MNSNVSYEIKKTLEIKTSGANSLCKLNSQWLCVLLSEENKGKIAIVNIEKMEYINNFELTNYEISAISNFYDDSIIIAYNEKMIEDKNIENIVFLKQFQISKFFGLEPIGEKTKDMSEYFRNSDEEKKTIVKNINNKNK